MNLKEHIIFKSYLFLTSEEENDWKKCIADYMNEDIEMEEQEAYTADSYEVFERLQDEIVMNYEDEQVNLNKLLPNNIIAFGSVGRWNGRFSAGKVFGNNLNEILYTGDCPDISVTYDRYDVHSTLAHHDGRHSMTYRMIKEGVDEDMLMEKIVYGGGLTKQEITRYTKSLVPFIKLCYGK